MPYEPETVQVALFDDIDNRLRISRATIAGLSGVNAAVISKASSGQRNLSYPEFKQLRELVDDLIEIQTQAGAIPVDWTDVRVTRKLIESLREERKIPLQPLSQSEADLLHKFATGDDIDSLAIEVRMSRGELLDKISELVSRSGRLASAAK